MEHNLCKHITVRLNYSNPEHMKVLGILDNLNMDIYKSKNRFIIEAILYYVDNLSNEITLNKLTGKSAYVSEQELEEKLKELKKELKSEIYEEILRAAIGAKLPAPDTAETSGNVLDKVMSWSED